MQEIIRSPPKEIQTTQDVGYYAPDGSNPFKLSVPCTFEFSISATPYLQTHHLESIFFDGRDSKAPTGGLGLWVLPARSRGGARGGPGGSWITLRIQPKARYPPFSKFRSIDSKKEDIALGVRRLLSLWHYSAFSFSLEATVRH
jgi:hypothetical protein